jgi:hypothetical protein
MEIVAFRLTFPDGVVREWGPNILRETFCGKVITEEVRSTGIKWSRYKGEYVSREAIKYGVAVRSGNRWHLVNFTNSMEGARSSGELNVLTFKCDEYHVCKIERVIKLVEVEGK